METNLYMEMFHCHAWLAEGTWVPMGTYCKISQTNPVWVIKKLLRVDPFGRDLETKTLTRWNQQLKHLRTVTWSGQCFRSTSTSYLNHRRAGVWSKPRSSGPCCGYAGITSVSSHLPIGLSHVQSPQRKKSNGRLGVSMTSSDSSPWQHDQIWYQLGSALAGIYIYVYIHDIG